MTRGSPRNEWRDGGGETTQEIPLRPAAATQRSLRRVARALALLAELGELAAEAVAALGEACDEAADAWVER